LLPLGPGASYLWKVIPTLFGPSSGVEVDPPAPRLDPTKVVFFRLIRLTQFLFFEPVFRLSKGRNRQKAANSVLVSLGHPAGPHGVGPTTRSFPPNCHFPPVVFCRVIFFVMRVLSRGQYPLPREYQFPHQFPFSFSPSGSPLRQRSSRTYDNFSRAFSGCFPLQWSNFVSLSPPPVWRQDDPICSLPFYTNGLLSFRPFRLTLFSSFKSQLSHTLPPPLHGSCRHQGFASHDSHAEDLSRDFFRPLGIFNVGSLPPSSLGS